MKQNGEEPPRSSELEKKKDEIHEFQNYEYTALETEIKIANNLLNKLKNMAPEVLVQRMNLQQQQDQTKIKIASFKRDQARAQTANLKAQGKKEFAQRRELILKNEKILQLIKGIQAKIQQAESESPSPSRRGVGRATEQKNALDAFCSQKNLSKEDVERAVTFLPIRNISSLLDEGGEQAEREEVLGDQDIIEEMRSIKTLKGIKETLENKQQQQQNLVVGPRYVNGEMNKRQLKQAQKEQLSELKARKIFTLKEFLGLF